MIYIYQVLGTYICILRTVLSIIILCEQASCISYNYYNNAAGASVVTVKLWPLAMRVFVVVRWIGVVEKKEEGSSAVSCIIDHEGFHSVCLDVWVLQTAYFNYQQHYAVAEEKAVH